jgi:hypothetical protein
MEGKHERSRYLSEQEGLPSKISPTYSTVLTVTMVCVVAVCKRQYLSLIGTHHNRFTKPVCLRQDAVVQMRGRGWTSLKGKRKKEGRS